MYSHPTAERMRRSGQLTRIPCQLAPGPHPLSDIYRRLASLYDRAALRHLRQAFAPGLAPTQRIDLCKLASSAQRAGDRWRARAANGA